ncbi:hypothetical protein ZIOFF_064462 [Zingiber officinale]|uniref:Inositol polyphosphate-related phosphatase domain-containing protein n=1 Tax=Zingiber officinale TaxID=94328 RepID=A0A8J5K6Q2_ZINOF|nr:hypothetical protein ZIOFF_064462 [Zingiber officinale]
MWPRLVANKLLRRPVGGNSFVTDIPCSQTPFEFIDFDQLVIPKQLYGAQKDTRRYKLFVSTWNVGGILPTEDVNLEDWLDINNYYDIYVLGFQEVVPLSAKNVLGKEKRRILVQWNSLIRRTLNRSSCGLEGGREGKAGERQKCGCAVSCSATFATQGSLALAVASWDALETSFCFVCCHLASGGKEGDKMNRNSDAVQILSRTSFPRGPSLDLPQKILDHERVVLFGDLNYRISLPEATTRSLVEDEQWNTLLQKDELRAEVSKGRAFEDWQEGGIAFFPTYKYYPNSDNYHGFIQGQKGEKRRAPAWCDRILWHGEGIKQERYDRCESKLSDHRPVRGTFTVNVEVLRSFNSLRSFFSERFHSERSHLFEKDGYSSAERTSLHALFWKIATVLPGVENLSSEKQDDMVDAC